MRCPSCDREVEGGSSACPGCGAPLGAEGEITATELVPVFKTADGALLAVLKTVLDAAGVPYVVQGEGALGLLPLGPLAIGVSRNLMEATIHVPRSREREARDLLHGFRPAEPEA